MWFVRFILLVGALILIRPASTFAECNPTMEAELRKYIEKAEEKLAFLEREADGIREQEVATFLDKGRIDPRLDGFLTETMTRLKELRATDAALRARYKRDCGEYRTTPGSGLGAAANKPQPAQLTGAATHNFAFESEPDAYALVSAPENWSWLKVFGDMQTGRHLIAMITCPTASGGNGRYRFECTYELRDYGGKDPNAGAPGRVWNGKSQVDLQIAPKRQSTLTLQFFRFSQTQPASVKTFHEPGAR